LQKCENSTKKTPKFHCQHQENIADLDNSKYLIKAPQFDEHSKKNSNSLRKNYKKYLNSPKNIEILATLVIVMVINLHHSECITKSAIFFNTFSVFCLILSINKNIPLDTFFFLDFYFLFWMGRNLRTSFRRRFSKKSVDLIKKCLCIQQYKKTVRKQANTEPQKTSSKLLWIELFISLNNDKIESP
jgi:hypothetical protein